jgi:hypothetical protein
MEEENGEEVCGNKKVAIRFASVRSANGGNRGLSDGRRKHSRRENYWHCILDRHNGMQHNSYVQ